MKIYKVELNPSNPVEKIVKIPVCSNYGIQITWNYEQFPKFSGTNIDTENGYLTNHDGKIEENTSFTEINGQKIYTNLPIIENVGNTIVFYYGKNETFEENKVQNFGSIKVVGVDADDFDVDVGGSSSIEGITYVDGNLTLSAENAITLIPYNRASNSPSVKIDKMDYFSRLSANYLWLKGNNNTIVEGSNVTIGSNSDGGSINFAFDNCFKLDLGFKKSYDMQANVEIYYNDSDAKPYIKLCEGGTDGRTLDTPLYDALAGSSEGGSYQYITEDVDNKTINIGCGDTLKTFINGCEVEIIYHGINTASFAIREGEFGPCAFAVDYGQHTIYVGRDDSLDLNLMFNEHLYLGYFNSTIITDQSYNNETTRITKHGGSYTNHYVANTAEIILDAFGTDNEVLNTDRDMGVKLIAKLDNDGIGAELDVSPNSVIKFTTNTWKINGRCIDIEKLLADYGID
jgi:hypothetical protein